MAIPTDPPKSFLEKYREFMLENALKTTVPSSILKGNNSEEAFKDIIKNKDPNIIIPIQQKEVSSDFLDAQKYMFGTINDILYKPSVTTGNKIQILSTPREENSAIKQLYEQALKSDPFAFKMSEKEKAMYRDGVWDFDNLPENVSNSDLDLSNAELREENRTLENENRRLKARITDLERKLAELERNTVPRIFEIDTKISRLLKL